jgi:hypothetical protein
MTGTTHSWLSFPTANSPLVKSHLPIAAAKTDPNRWLNLNEPIRLNLGERYRIDAKTLSFSQNSIHINSSAVSGSSSCDTTKSSSMHLSGFLILKSRSDLGFNDNTSIDEPAISTTCRAIRTIPKKTVLVKSRVFRGCTTRKSA